MVIRVVAEANLVIPGFEIFAEFTQSASQTRIEQIVVRCSFKCTRTGFECAIGNARNYGSSIRQSCLRGRKWIKWVTQRHTNPSRTHGSSTISLLKGVRRERNRS